MTDRVLATLLAPVLATLEATGYALEQTLHVVWDAEQVVQALTRRGPAMPRGP
jgi:hypothetical protein